MLQSQVHAFVVVTLAGAMAGLLFDLLRVIRWRLQPGAALGVAADLLYWVLVTLVLGSAVFAGNWGEIRLYVLIALGSGAALYFGLASPVMLLLFRLLTGILIALYTIAVRLVVIPLMAIAALLGRMGRIVWHLTGRPAARAVRWARNRGMHWQQRFLDRVRGWIVPRDEEPPGEDPPEGPPAAGP